MGKWGTEEEEELNTKKMAKGEQKEKSN